MTRLNAPAPEPGGKLPDCRGLALLRGAGWTYQDLMAEYGVSNQSVHRKMRKCELAEPRIDYSDVIPWRIRPEDRNRNINVLLRAAARERMGVARPLNDRRARELANWLAELDANDAVVDYGRARTPDGEITFGFHYVPRRPGVDDWIIRKPKAWIEHETQLAN